MLRGHVFSEQIFGNDCFAIFIDTFLFHNNGVIKGCSLSNSTSSITVGSGYFCMQGRFLEIVGSDTFTPSTDSAYCKLVCEVDLSKTNTETDLQQAKLKIISSTSAYPTLTQQDLFDGGDVYQFEFCRFKTSSTGISDFQDTRTYLDFENIYEKIENTISSLEDGSAYVLKTDAENFMSSDKIKIGSTTPTASDLDDGDIYLQYFS